MPVLRAYMNGAWTDVLAGVDVGLPVLTTVQRDALTGGDLWRGKTIFNTDTGAVEVYYGATTLWKPPWNVPWGEQGGVDSISPQTGITTTVDVTGLTVTWTALAGRRYLMRGVVPVFQVTSQGAVSLILADGSNNAVQNHVITVGANLWGLATVEKELTGLAGSVTYKIRLTTSAGTINTDLTSGRSAMIRVLDMGPSTNAPAS